MRNAETVAHDYITDCGTNRKAINSITRHIEGLQYRIDYFDAQQSGDIHKFVELHGDKYSPRAIQIERDELSLLKKARNVIREKQHAAIADKKKPAPFVRMANANASANVPDISRVFRNMYEVKGFSPQYLMAQIFRDSANMADHLTSKLRGYCRENTCDGDGLVKLFIELDSENQRRFIEWFSAKQF